MNDRLDELLSILCDGALPEGELAELGTLLESEANLDRYLRYLDLHTLLGGREVSPVPEPILREPRKRSRRIWLSVGAALAASVALVVWLAWPRLDPVELILIEMAGNTEVRDESGASASVAEGKPFLAGQTLRTDADSGYASLDLGDGSRLDLGPDARLRVASSKTGFRLILTAGWLRGEVKGASVTVVTPQAEVQLNRAKFLVSTTSPDATEVEAESGGVRTVRLADGQVSDLPAGSGLVISPSEEMTPRPMASPSGEAKLALSFKANAGSGLAYSTSGERLIARSKGSRYDRLDPLTGTSVAGGPQPSIKDEGSVALSGNGRILFLFHKPSGRVRVWDTQNDALRATFDTGAVHTQWATDSTGSRLAAAQLLSPSKFRLTVWDADGTERFARDLERWPRCVALSADGKRIAWAYDTPGQKLPRHRFYFTELDSSHPSRSVALPARPVSLIAFAPDGETIFTATDHGVVQSWEWQTGALRREFAPPDDWTRPAQSLAVSPDGGRIAAGRSDGRVHVWNSSGEGALLISAGTRPVGGLALSPDGTSLAVGPTREAVTVWKLP